MEKKSENVYTQVGKGPRRSTGASWGEETLFTLKGSKKERREGKTGRMLGENGEKKKSSAPCGGGGPPSSATITGKGDGIIVGRPSYEEFAGKKRKGRRGGKATKKKRVRVKRHWGRRGSRLINSWLVTL